ncbi:hypothetical protein T07_5357 [Trichinella nelsoni]|uniref:Uncharacterized protein n=1 Tax=Trichinella nelsoni TaxID=6336 RepID=A0A0V0RDW3_9BILA|nr:hypothetical protein T07_5357 [Trichinella nelsoni]
MKGARKPIGSKMLDAVLSIWRLESRPSRLGVLGGMKDKHPRVSVDRLSVGIALSAAGSLLAHLCRWNPPDAISSSSWVASVLASSGDSQDVAKSSTYMLHSTSDAARGAVAWCRRACTLTVLTAKNGEQVKPKHTLVSREICKRLGLLLGFESGGTCFQYPPVGQPGSGESEGEPLTSPSGWGVQPPAGCSMKSLRNALSRRTPRGISVLRLLPCRPHGVGGTMCALGDLTLLLVQPSRSLDTAAWLTSNHNCPCHFVLGVAQPW